MLYSKSKIVSIDFQCFKDYVCMHDCDFEAIEHYVFSNLKQLYLLDLNRNWINYIANNAFLNLTNLETLYLSANQLTSIDPEYIGLGNSVKCQIFFVDRV